MILPRLLICSRRYSVRGFFAGAKILFDRVTQVEKGSAFAAREKKPPRHFAGWNQTTPTSQQNVSAASFR
jgi:hypothetical protein